MAYFLINPKEKPSDRRITMCGRYTRISPPAVLEELFGVPIDFDLKPHYNIAPTQSVLAVRVSEKDEKEAVSLRWGLIPPWAKDEKMGYKTFNARGETVAEKPSFRSAFKRKRCLVIADGFFEWKRDGKQKHPFLIKMRDEKPFAFAGLWENWKNPKGESVQSCTIVTTEPNKLMGKIHDRMPVILSPRDFELWLNTEEKNLEKAKKLIRPFPVNPMTSHPVSDIVNSSRNNSPDCIKPL